jgi:hypothetical protein
MRRVLKSIIAAAAAVASLLLASQEAANAAPRDAELASVQPASGITAAQRARLADKLRLMDQTLRVVDAGGGTTMTAAQRRWAVETLSMMPLEKIRAIGNPASFPALTTAIGSVQNMQVKALGSSTIDLVYRPITPCRYIDTRVLPPAVGVAPYPVNLGATGATYGGSAGCNIVAAAQIGSVADLAAVSMNVGIVNPQFQPGFLGARPTGSGNATSLVNWYQSGPTVQASNAAIVTTAPGQANQIEFFGTPTDLVVDILGVFTRPDATALDCTTVPQAGGAGTVLPNTAFTDLFQPPVCAAGYTPVAIGCEYGPTPPAGLALNSVGVADPTAGFVSCAWFNGSASTLSKSDFHIHTRCCRVPGR